MLKIKQHGLKKRPQYPPSSGSGHTRGQEQQDLLKGEKAQMGVLSLYIVRVAAYR